MPEVTSHKPGSFSWSELVTSDQSAAKDFYTKLFNWKANDQPMGPDQFYTMLEKNGKTAAALYGMDDQQKQRGIPPHWNLYVSVKSADEAANKAKGLGAQVIMEPFDVMDVGRMAIIQDPTGANIMVWEAKKHIGAEVIDEPNAFCWYELYTNDTEKAKNFYTQMFGWSTGGGADYTEWKLGDKSMGGMMKIQPEMGPMPPNWMPYVMVEDANATAAKATELGAKLYMGPADIPNMGRFAILGDPQGATFAIYQAGQR